MDTSQRTPSYTGRALPRRSRGATKTPAAEPAQRGLSEEDAKRLAEIRADLARRRLQGGTEDARYFLLRLLDTPSEPAQRGAVRASAIEECAQWHETHADEAEKKARGRGTSISLQNLAALHRGCADGLRALDTPSERAKPDAGDLERARQVARSYLKDICDFSSGDDFAVGQATLTTDWLANRIAAALADARRAGEKVGWDAVLKALRWPLTEQVVAMRLADEDECGWAELNPHDRNVWRERAAKDLRELAEHLASRKPSTPITEEGGE